MSRKFIFILFLFSFLIVVGCEKEKSSSPVISDGKEINTSKMVHEHCTRAGTISNGEVSLNYDLYYTGQVLNVLVGEEKVMSPSDEILDTYEEAYRKIHQHYKDLDYYDTDIIRGDTTVMSKVTINYDEIDIKELLSIEGEEDNIIEDGVAKVEKWKTLAKKFGTSCEVVED